VNIPDMPAALNELFGSMIAMDDPRHARLAQHRLARLHGRRRSRACRATSSGAPAS